MNRNARVRLAEETVRILEVGHYDAPNGERVDLSECLRNSIDSTRTVRPAEWAAILPSALATRPQNAAGCIEVTGETTLAALERLVVDERCANVVALNFASAKNPGGGFLGGSQAQEESLARASGLYATLLTQNEYYDANRACRTTLYTDHAILSPSVPVFRHESGELRSQPFNASFITMPAVNVGAIGLGSDDLNQVESVMRRRINSVFALAAGCGSRHIVLGAWGCGVFRNDPAKIARWFADSLNGPESWRAFFDRIVFAVYESSEPAVNRPPFEQSMSII